MEKSSSATFELELEDVLDLLQCSTDAAKEEVRDTAGKWRVAKAWNGPIYLIENMSGYRNFAIVGAGTLGNYIIRQFLKERLDAITIG